jgi:hypothetical protein
MIMRNYRRLNYNEALMVNQNYIQKTGLQFRKPVFYTIPAKAGQNKLFENTLLFTFSSHYLQG